MGDVAMVPLHGGTIHTALDDGEPVVILKPTIEGMGLSYSRQLRKLKTRSWAVVAETATTGADGKTYRMACCGLDTWSMLLANIDENKVNEAARPLVIAYQRESARALRDYWTEGGAINPAATVDQLDALDRTIARAREQAAVLAALQGVVDANWLETKGRHIAAVALGVEPDVDPAARPLTVGEYLEGRGVSGARLRSLSTIFGRQLKALYRARHGVAPGSVDRFVDGALRPVAAYTETDRDLFDQTWAAVAARPGLTGPGQ